MSMLHGNFRRKATDVDYAMAGQNVANWIQGSNIYPDFRGGGFVVASFASGLSGAGFLVESAIDLMTSTYGATMISNMLLQGSGSLGSNSAGIGFKVIPFAFMDFSGDGGSGAIFYTLSTTGALAADDSIVVITPKVYRVCGPVIAASNVSVHFVMQGWIVSAPSNVR